MKNRWMGSRLSLVAVALVAVVMASASFSISAYAQSAPAAAPAMNHSAAAAPQSETQKAFSELKTLEGKWEGPLTTDPPDPTVQGKTAHLSLRVTSMGNALMHEMRMDGHKDDPITMLYMDGDRLLLTHYCDAGNRPRMTGKLLGDGKTVEFAFLDIAGANVEEHMDHSKFTPVDANHHQEDWTFMMGEQPVKVHIDLHRVE